MNSLALCLVLALAAASVQAGTVKRSEETPIPSLSDIVTEAERHFADFTSAMQSLFTPGEARDATLDKISSNLSNQSHALAEQVQTLVNNINNAIKNGQPNEALQQAADRLNGTVRQLLGERTATEAEQASTQLSESVKNAVQTVVEEASKISRTVESETAPMREELGVATRSAVKQALDLADYLRQQFEQAVAVTAAPA